MTLLQVSGQSDPIAPPEHRMNMYAWFAVRSHDDIADEGSDFDLLLDGYGAVLLRLPVEERKLGAAQRADRSHLRRAEPFLDGEVLSPFCRMTAKVRLPLAS